jgi:hypothetical protein
VRYDDDDLAKLIRDKLIALGATQTESLIQCISELEAGLGQPPKTADNSSVSAAAQAGSGGRVGAIRDNLSLTDGDTEHRVEQLNIP